MHFGLGIVTSFNILTQLLPRPIKYSKIENVSVYTMVNFPPELAQTLALFKNLVR